MGPGVVEHSSPCGRGRLHAEAEEAESRFGEDGGRHSYGSLHDDGLQDVGENVAEHKAEVSGSQRAGGLDEFTLLHRHDLRSHQAGVAHPAGDGEGEDEVLKSWAKEGNDGNRQQNPGECEEGVGDVDVDDGVCDATEEAGCAAEDETENQRNGDDRDGNGQRNPGAVDGAGEDVASELVGAEPVMGGRTHETGIEVELGGVVGGEPRGEEGHDDEAYEQYAAEGRHGLVAQPGKGGIAAVGGKSHCRYVT